jgi:hypothetical protein
MFNTAEDRPTTSKLVLYIAPTAAGCPGNHRIIFVCAVRLAEVGDSDGRKRLPGCNTAMAIPAALDYTRSKSGSIVKVDNSNVANVEIMICDVKSYLTAMYYMMSFNDKDDIIMYWDSPPSVLTETHELHGEIKP